MPKSYPAETGESARPPFGKRLSLPSGYEVHYLESGSGFPVVFLHGSGPGASAYSNFKENAPVLARAGMRVLLLDEIGFGYSSKPSGIDYTLDLFCTVLREFLDALGIEQCALVGNSLGGAIALKASIDEPHRISKLVVMAPGGIESRETYFAMPGMQRMVSSFVSGALDRAGLKRILELLVFDPAVVTDELIDDRFHILQTQPKDVLARMKIPDLTAELHHIRCPVLGFWGMEDQFMPPTGYEKILRACPDSRFVMLARCGHWAMLEHRDEFNRYVMEFLRHA
jgi:4,5:9,10-diseco-3-hydroxy-5,9,17-trioxoandrosta-1(10),2-diene-4-oate hydrolase